MRLFIFFILVVLVGCGGGGGGSSDGGSSGSGLLAESVSIADFNVVSTVTLTEEQIRENINSNSAFYRSFPSSGGASARSECIDAMEDQYGEITKQDSYYQFSFEKDIKDCNSNSTDMQSEKRSLLVTYLSRFTNGSSIDLTEYTFNNLPASSSGTFLEKYYRELIWNNNNKYMVMTLYSKQSDPTSPCDWTSTTLNDCESRRKNINYDNNDLKTITGVELQKYYFNNIVGSGGTYYSSGSMEFRIENWAGTVIFNGSSTPSTYTASNGSQTITGTLDPSGVSQVVYQDSPTSLY